MNYVVVDFEWNQACYGKGSEDPKIPFEIIEIGAVKLDENLKEDRPFQPDHSSESIQETALYYTGSDRDYPGGAVCQRSVFLCTGRFYAVVRQGLYFLHMGQYGPGGIAAQHEILWPVGSFEGAGHGKYLQRAEVFSITLCA